MTVYALPGFDGVSRRFTTSVANLSYVDGPSRSRDFNCTAIRSLAVERLVRSAGTRVTREVRTYIVRVQARMGWQYAGFSVQAGDRVTFIASQEVEAAPGESVTANGLAPWSYPLACEEKYCRCPVCEVPTRSLVGSIGIPHLSEPRHGFFIGRDFVLEAERAGRLYLVFNEPSLLADRSGWDPGGVANNRGEFLVQITVAR